MEYYKPKTGSNAGRKNFQAIKKCLRENPEISGRKIAEILGLSTVTVYSHLKKLQKKTDGVDNLL